MARKRVKLAWIVNDSKRKSCMKKRRQNFIKKVEELTILCGVQAFCLVQSPDEPEFVVWPPDELEARQVLSRFVTMSEFEQNKKVSNQETHLRDSIKKVEGSHRALLKRMTDLELAYLMDELHNGKGLQGMDMAGLECLSLLVKERLKELRQKAECYEMDTTNDGFAMATLLGDRGCNFSNGVGANIMSGSDGFRFDPNMVMGNESVIPTGGDDCNDNQPIMVAEEGDGGGNSVNMIGFFGQNQVEPYDVNCNGFSSLCQ